MKRTLTSLSVLALVVCALAGCGQVANPLATKTPTAPGGSIMTPEGVFDSVWVSQTVDAVAQVAGEPNRKEAAKAPDSGEYLIYSAEGREARVNVSNGQVVDVLLVDTSGGQEKVLQKKSAESYTAP